MRKLTKKLLITSGIVSGALLVTAIVGTGIEAIVSLSGSNQKIINPKIDKEDVNFK